MELKGIIKICSLFGGVLLVAGITGCSALQTAWGTRGDATDIPPDQIPRTSSYQTQEEWEQQRYSNSYDRERSYYDNSYPYDAEDLGIESQPSRNYTIEEVGREPPRNYGVFDQPQESGIRSFEKKVLTRP